MRRARSRARHLASAALIGAGASAGAQTLPDTSLSLDPASRHADSALLVIDLTSPPPAEEPAAPSLRTLLLDDADAPAALRAHASDGPSDVSLSVGRSTVLLDGGIGETGGAIADEVTRRERHAGYGHAAAEFDLYDLSLQWPAVSRGPMTLSLIGGLRAISAQAGQRVDERVAPGQTATSYDESRGLVTVPIVGTGVRVDLAEGLYLSGAAATHTIADGATLLDFTAQTGYELSPNVSVFAGYQLIRSSVDVGPIDAELDQEGLFARVRIRF